MISGAELDRVDFRATESATPDLVYNMLTASDSRSSSAREAAISLIASAIEGDDRQIKTIDTSLFILLLYLLRSIDERPLTLRVLNSLRDRIQRASMAGTLEDMETYAKSMNLPLSFEPADRSLSLGFVDFIRYCSKLSGYQYRLVSQFLRSGKIILTKEVAAHVIRECFVANAVKFYESLDATRTETAVRPYSGFVRAAKEEYIISREKARVDMGNVDSTKFPPCITEFVKQIREGTNLPHMARFTMVSFLHKIGMENHDIMEIFRSAPDFNEKVTTYQVNHITGEISGTQYSPPKCVVLQSNHLCYKGSDTLCAQEWLQHPLRYYMIKKKSDKQSAN